MSSQHGRPLLLGADGARYLDRVPLGAGSTVAEDFLQRLLHDHPELLPVDEIDDAFAGPVALCRELATMAGPIDNVFVNRLGLPTLVECKLWRNPEARRKVVGQILDYAKEIGRWSYADLQREVNRATKRDGNVPFEIVRERHPDLDEARFVDSVSRNLRQGRFLLLIVGDGIREGVEAIADYLQRHAGLHFVFGLVELPIFEVSGGERLVLPRVVARTATISRAVVSVAEGLRVEDAEAVDEDAAIESDDRSAARAARNIAFWTQFLSKLRLADPEQPIPEPSRIGYVSFMMPAPKGSSWLTVYRDTSAREVGLFLSFTRGSVGEIASERIIGDWSEVGPALAGHAAAEPVRGADRIGESLKVADLEDATAREPAFEWLRERVDRYVSVLRPRVRAAVADVETQD